MAKNVEVAPVLNEEGRSLLFTGARTVNNFAKTHITDRQLREIWELAKWPPTAANTQPLRCTFVRTPEGRRRIVRHLDEGNVTKTLSAPVTAILAVDSEFHEHIPTLLPFRPEMRGVFANDDDMRDRTGAFNSALQAGYFILATRALGFGAGPMAGFDGDSLDLDFFPDKRFRSILLVNIGYPGENGWMGRLPRLSDAHALDWA